jgi:uncharacterized metal-binding protein YceD (DUF177 family)
MTSTGDTTLPDARIRIDNLPPEGRTLEVTSTAEERARIATRMGVSSVDAFSAKITTEAVRGGVRATGMLTARITQPCVVTTEPVAQEISEPLNRLFLPRSAASKPGPAAEVFVDLDDEDEPDAFEGPEVDMTPYLMEMLALAIDPYPRAPGARLPEDRQAQDTPESPFAKLQSLKNDLK